MQARCSNLNGEQAVKEYCEIQNQFNQLYEFLGVERIHVPGTASKIVLKRKHARHRK